MGKEVGMASSDGYVVRYDKDSLRRACERGCRGERVETMWTGGGIEGSSLDLTVEAARAQEQAFEALWSQTYWVEGHSPLRKCVSTPRSHVSSDARF